MNERIPFESYFEEEPNLFGKGATPLQPSSTRATLLSHQVLATLKIPVMRTERMMCFSDRADGLDQILPKFVCYEAWKQLEHPKQHTWNPLSISQQIAFSEHRPVATNRQTDRQTVTRKREHGALFFRFDSLRHVPGSRRKNLNRFERRFRDGCF